MACVSCSFSFCPSGTFAEDEDEEELEDELEDGKDELEDELEDALEGEENGLGDVSLRFWPWVVRTCADTCGSGSECGMIRTDKATITGRERCPARCARRGRGDGRCTRLGGFGVPRGDVHVLLHGHA